MPWWVVCLIAINVPFFTFLIASGIRSYRRGQEEIANYFRAEKLWRHELPELTEAREALELELTNSVSKLHDPTAESILRSLKDHALYTFAPERPKQYYDYY
jgi:hypothetical protein